MTRPVPDRAVAFVKKHEGCELDAYQDSALVWTIGYGHTGSEVKRGLKITQMRADDYLREDLGVAARRLAGVVKAEIIAGLTESQYAALLSFVFNLGANADWTIWKALNRGELDAVPAQMARFVNAGGRKLKGLVNRRNAEIALWQEDEVEPEALPSAVTRAIETPPTPAPERPMAKQSLALKVGQLAATGAGAAAAVKDQVAPHTAAVPFFAKVVMVCTIIGVLFALYQLYIHRVQHEARKV